MESPLSPSLHWAWRGSKDVKQENGSHTCWHTQDFPESSLSGSPLSLTGFLATDKKRYYFQFKDEEDEVTYLKFM